MSAEPDENGAPDAPPPDISAQWLRWHHGTVNDPKFGAVASRTCTRTCEVLGVWAVLLERASQAKPRGVVAGLDIEATAFLLGIDPDAVDRILADLSQPHRGHPPLITGDTLTAWSRRQLKRERHDWSTERTRRYRERQGTQGTPGNTTGTPGNAREPTEESRGDKTRSRSVPAPTTETENQSSSSARAGARLRARARAHVHEVKDDDDAACGGLEAFEMETDRRDLVHLLGFNGQELDQQVSAWRKLVSGPKLDVIIVSAQGRQLDNPRAYVTRCVGQAVDDAQEARKAKPDPIQDIIARAHAQRVARGDA